MLQAAACTPTTLPDDFAGVLIIFILISHR